MKTIHQSPAILRQKRPCGFLALALTTLVPLFAPSAKADFTVPIRAGSSIHFVWVGDLNGDGNMDYVLDRPWDNQQKIEAYTHNGTFLWDIDFGPNSVGKDNISPASATIDVGHWDGVTVSDLNNDGRAEVIIKFANGTRFGDGSTWVNSDNNKQWIAVLNGSTGARLAYASIPTDFIARGPMGCQLGVGNSGIFASMKNRNADGSFNMMVCRYTWSGGNLNQAWKWIRNGTNGGPDGHQFRICDVNRDGVDDYCQIGFALNGSNASRLYGFDSQGIVHGDRFHIAKMDPGSADLLGWGVQQDNPSGLLEFAYNARTGSMLWKHMGTTSDVGRGDVGDIDPRFPGYEAWSFYGVYNVQTNTKLANNSPYPVLRLWWDTDDLSESYNDGKIEKWNHTNNTVGRLVTTWNYESAVGSDRGCPMFYGDFLGDWREEVVLANSAFNKLVIFTPPGTSNTRSTLRNDQYYKNCLTLKGYMQSHHTSFYIGHTGSVGSVPANGTWRITNRNSGKALDCNGAGTSDGTQIIQWTYSGANNQRWTLQDRGSGQFSIIGVQSGKALDVNASATANGTKVQLWTYGGANNQKFTFTAVGSGYYRITPVHATGSCLDVNGYSMADGALVQLWTYSNNANQQWSFNAP